MSENVEQHQVMKDLFAITNDEVSDNDLKDLSESLKNYVSSRELENKTPQDLVNIILIAFEALEVPEYRLNEVIQRLNVMQIMHSGVSKSSQKRMIH